MSRIIKTAYAEEQCDWYYEMTELGLNYRMSDMQAALGLSQLRKIDEFIERRREIGALYNEKLADVPGVLLPKQLSETDSGWHLYTIQLDSKVLTKSRREIFDEMRAFNIGVHVHYIPVYWQPYYRDLGYELGLCPVAEKWYAQALTLPVFPGMTDEDVGDVVGTLVKILHS